MTLREWLDLTDSERAACQKEWSPYEDGYWHDLATEAAAKLRTEIAHNAHVRDVTSGVYHGGTLIIGVVNDLAYPGKLDLPSYYLGFPLLQFCGGNEPT